MPSSVLVCYVIQVSTEGASPRNCPRVGPTRCSFCTTRIRIGVCPHTLYVRIKRKNTHRFSLMPRTPSAWASRSFLHHDRAVPMLSYSERRGGGGCTSRVNHRVCLRSSRYTLATPLQAGIAPIGYCGFGVCLQIPDTVYQYVVPGTSYEVPGISYQVPGTWYDNSKQPQGQLYKSDDMARVPTRIEWPKAMIHALILLGT